MSPIVVMLHGFLGGAWSFDRVRERLSPGTRVLTPTLSYHEGKGPEHPSLPDFDQEVARLAGIIAQAGVGRVELVGYSMGGRLALGVSIVRPDLVNRLVLVSSRRGLDTPAERASRIQADEGWAQLLESRGLHAFLESWSKQLIFRGMERLPREVITEEHDQRMQHNPAGLAAAIRRLGLGNQASYAREIRQLSVPVTLIAGALDEKFVTLSRQLESEVPDGRCVVVEGVSHQLLLEAPEVVARIIEEGMP